MRALSILVIALLGSTALAQDEPTAREVRYKAVQEIDFEVTDVYGTHTRPKLTLTLETKGLSFPSLIELRSDFNEEMRQSVLSVQ